MDDAHRAGSSVYENVKKDLGGTEADDAMTKEESEDVVEVFEGITVTGKSFSFQTKSTDDEGIYM